MTSIITATNIDTYRAAVERKRDLEIELLSLYDAILDELEGHKTMDTVDWGELLHMEINTRLLEMRQGVVTAEHDLECAEQIRDEENDSKKVH
jgi:hypothetical protein